MEERRSYFRLLRYLLSEQLETDYKKELDKPLPPRIEDLLSQLDSRERDGTH
jgi:hypothetical protein